MVAAVLIVLATVLLGAVSDAVVESAIAGGRTIEMLGQTVATPGTAGTLGILTAASAGAVLAWVAAIAHARGRRLERRLSDELDERWEDLSQKVAGELGRKTLLEWRVVELRNQVDDLVSKRDELLEEMNAVRERTGEMQRLIRQQREALATNEAAPAPAGEGALAGPRPVGPTGEMPVVVGTSNHPGDDGPRSDSEIVREEEAAPSNEIVVVPELEPAAQEREPEPASQESEERDSGDDGDRWR